jgi:hypothetical protein
MLTDQLLGVRRHAGKVKSEQEWKGGTHISDGEHCGDMLK